MRKLAALVFLALITASGALLLLGDWQQSLSPWMERDEFAWLRPATAWLGEAAAHPAAGTRDEIGHSTAAAQ